ncbi:MAG TPA: NAD(P)/FAD-dependent oxidoreductase [Candidatus Sulfotelmatobacter sp.]|nr:NAD(P)/FAD-dependent oxidoreductase [Candidatus Sulfotelmatobacter sp.]
MLDAVVVGSGPNGLAAAITLAEAERSVLVLEAEPTVGGGARSAELTLPGFIHDICSAVHPLAAGSPFFRARPLDQHGLELIHPAVALAHPLDDGSAAVLGRSLTATAHGLGKDGDAYRRLMEPLVEHAPALLNDVLAPLHIPRHPSLLSAFARNAIRSAQGLAKSRFRTAHARALIAGIGAHSCLPLEKPGTAAFSIVLGLTAHAYGWPLAAGGSQAIADAMVRYLAHLDGEVRTGTRVRNLRDIPEARAVLFDVTPRQLVSICGDQLPARYRRRLDRYKYGPGVFKIDYALDGPIPWKAHECHSAGTVHVGGTIEEISRSESEVARGRCAERPFVLVAQPSLVDPKRAPEKKHVAWMYCHVPNGSTQDMTAAIEAQIERFAPGFRERVLAKHVMTPQQLEEHNANCVGGDISGGVQDLRHQFFRPVMRISPYTTPNPKIFICSSSTPPGGGVHGMSGYYGAVAALSRTLRSG